MDELLERVDFDFAYCDYLVCKKYLDHIDKNQKWCYEPAKEYSGAAFFIEKFLAEPQSVTSEERKKYTIKIYVSTDYYIWILINSVRVYEVNFSNFNLDTFQKKLHEFQQNPSTIGY